MTQLTKNRLDRSLEPERAEPMDPPDWTPPLENEFRFARNYIDPGMEILDAGCGRGLLSQDLAGATFPGRVTGIDLDSDCVRHATRLAQGLEIWNLSFATGSVYELPFRATSFDMVFAGNLIDRLTSPLIALCEMRRVLRPGGVLAARFSHAIPATPFHECLNAAGFEIQDTETGQHGRLKSVIALAWVR